MDRNGHETEEQRLRREAEEAIRRGDIDWNSDDDEDDDETGKR